MKKLILAIDRFDFNQVGNALYLIAYVVNSTLVWIGWLFLSEDAYTLNLFLSFFIGMFGVLTFFFPFIVAGIIWDALVKWAQKERLREAGWAQPIPTHFRLFRARRTRNNPYSKSRGTPTPVLHRLVFGSYARLLSNRLYKPSRPYDATLTLSNASGSFSGTLISTNLYGAFSGVGLLTRSHNRLEAIQCLTTDSAGDA